MPFDGSREPLLTHSHGALPNCYDENGHLYANRIKKLQSDFNNDTAVL